MNPVIGIWETPWEMFGYFFLFGLMAGLAFHFGFSWIGASLGWIARAMGGR